VTPTLRGRFVAVAVVAVVVTVVGAVNARSARTDERVLRAWLAERLGGAH
jgi:hypothetical protein